jgi:hypothetical protein
MLVRSQRFCDTWQDVSVVTFSCKQSLSYPAADVAAVQMDVDTMMAKTLLADMGLMGPGQQQQGKGALTADGLRQVAAASSGKVQPTAAMTKTISMQ